MRLLMPNKINTTNSPGPWLGCRRRRRVCVKRSLVIIIIIIIPGGEFVLLLAGPGPGYGGQVVDRTHTVDGGVEFLQLLPDVVQLLGVRREVAGIRLAGFAAPFFALDQGKRESRVKLISSCKEAFQSSLVSTFFHHAWTQRCVRNSSTHAGLKNLALLWSNSLTRCFWIVQSKKKEKKEVLTWQKIELHTNNTLLYSNYWSSSLRFCCNCDTVFALHIIFAHCFHCTALCNVYCSVSH